jgi:ADP-heptose:LPS heptosyltransferase
MSRSTHLERRLDRVFGIPIVFLIGLFRRRRSLPASPRRIGILQPSAIGDMFLISGLLVHLRACYPDAQIHLFHGPYNGEAVPLLPVDVIAHPCVFTRPIATLRQLRNAELDILINSAPWTRITAFLTALSGARTTIGFLSAGQHIHPAFDIAVPYFNDRHEIENHRAVAELFAPLTEYKLQLRKMRRKPSIELPYERLILMHMAAGGSAALQKSWPAENWLVLARRLIEQGWVVGFTGASADATSVQAVQTKLPNNCCFSLAGRLDLSEVSYVLEHARLLVTIDTGIAHLAAALNANVVALHGPTRFERWGSRSAHAIGLNSPHSASGYINYGFEQHLEGGDVMAALSVDDVEALVQTVLSQSNLDKASMIRI